MQIRRASKQDFDHIWPIFREIVAAGDTYAYPTDISKEQAFVVWMEAPRETYVFEDDGQILGTYYLKTNQSGPGDHVCNCGYMVSSAARGRGLATAMCEHSQEVAKELKKLGFEIVGRLPKAFFHPANGYVDALVMYKWLD
jgi:RimJ/RimL family protein N-acetyltransferase